MLNNNVRVAILLATYNGSKYLSEFLDSIVNQSHQNFVIIARDDGSNDNTVEILNSYSGRLPIRDVSDGIKLGPAQSFMKLLELAGDEFDCYAFSDQDDVWRSDKLARALEAIIEDQSVPVLYCSCLEYVNENLDHIKFSPKPRIIGFRNALVENIATGCTVVVNAATRSLVLSKPPLTYTMHDWWCYIVVSAFGKVIYDDYPSIKYRQHGNNVIGAPSHFKKWKRRILRFWFKENDVYGIYRQADEFSNSFGSQIMDPERLLLHDLLEGKRSCYTRIRLCIGSSFIRQRPLDNLILRLLFFLNWY